MFNPAVNVFRIHWFYVSPCYDLVSSRSLSKFGARVLSQKRYYESSSSDHPSFSLQTLGRRSLAVRKFNGKTYRPHKFWSKYMSGVAGPEYRGRWLGLAPMHFRFKPADNKKLFGLHPDLMQNAEKLLPGLKRIRAFPKAFVCPIGWVIAISMEIEGAFSFNGLPDLMDHLRAEKVFLYNGAAAGLKEAIREMQSMIEGSLLARKPAQLSDDDIALYSVSSPVAFAGQSTFSPQAEQLDLTAIFRVIGEGPAPKENRRLVTPGGRSIAITGFNRGTMLISTGAGKAPECALSNLKNLLLMTTLMQKYHQGSQGHSDPAVAVMRSEVTTTFRLLENRWEGPHFKQICANHEGIIKLLQQEPAPANSQGTFEMETQRLNTILAFVFGVIFISAILALVVVIPNPTPTQWKVFCVVLALAAGGVSGTISGMLKVDLTFTKRAVIGATGALAVFVIVYFFVPAMAK
jgi:hypothetical protein